MHIVTRRPEWMQSAGTRQIVITRYWHEHNRLVARVELCSLPSGMWRVDLFHDRLGVSAVRYVPTLEQARAVARRLAVA